MNHSVLYLGPLSVVFALSITACCGNLDSYSETASLSDAEIIALLTASSATGDTGNTTTATSSTTTTTTSTTTTTTGSTTTDGIPEHTCEDLCWAYFGYYDYVSSCSEAADASVPGNTLLSCDFTEECVGGRFHQVIDANTRASGRTALGTWLAQMAHDEAASALAFHALEAELRHHDAPSELRKRILEAAADEVGHARVVRQLAEDRGGVVPAPVTRASSARSLFDIALENVTEGCVQETWLAMRAWVQARKATDTEVRQAMIHIAIEETQHAELARDLDIWMRSQLSAAENEQLNQARDQAVRDLMARIDAGHRPRFKAAGLPSAAEEQQMIRSLAAAIWW